MPKSRTTSPTTACFQRFSPRRSAIWALHHPEPRPHRHQSGGITPFKAPTRRRHAARRLRMAQNPHCHTASRQPGWHTPPNWIGYCVLDRLISYPEAPFLSKTELPIQNARHRLLRGRRRAWAQGRWTDDVTNVVKPEQFEAPCEACCYKRRQSAPKNHYFQQKSRRIDDVCNNTQKIRQQSQRTRPL